MADPLRRPRLGPRPPRKLRIGFCPTCGQDRPIRGYRCVACKKRVHLRSESKFGNVPTRDASGQMRQSHKEAAHGSILHAALNAGAISELQAQVRYRLDVYGSPEVEALLQAFENGPPWPSLEWCRKIAADVRQSKTHVCDYILDFQYRDELGEMRYEDPKGWRQGHAYQIFRLKQRLMRACHGIRVKEV